MSVMHTTICILLVLCHIMRTRARTPSMHTLLLLLLASILHTVWILLVILLASNTTLVVVRGQIRSN